MAELTKHKAADVLQELLDRWYAPKGWLFTEKCAALEMAISELRRPVRGPETGLVNCGCGGKAMIHECHKLSHVIYCDKCLIETNYQLTADAAKDAWNTAMGYTAPPRPGAIVPDAGEMAPNGDEGAEE